MPPNKADNAYDEVAFIKLCFKYYKEPLSKANFDFESVAKESGVKDAQAAYQRFWAIKQKWGMSGAKKKGEDGNAAAASGKKKETPTGSVSEANTASAHDGSTPDVAEDDSEASTEILDKTPSKKTKIDEA